MAANSSAPSSAATCVAAGQLPSTWLTMRPTGLEDLLFGGPVGDAACLMLVTARRGPGISTTCVRHARGIMTAATATSDRDSACGFRVLQVVNMGQVFDRIDVVVGRRISPPGSRNAPWRHTPSAGLPLPGFAPDILIWISSALTSAARDAEQPTRPARSAALQSPLPRGLPDPRPPRRLPRAGSWRWRASCAPLRCGRTSPRWPLGRPARPLRGTGSGRTHRQPRSVASAASDRRRLRVFLKIAYCRSVSMLRRR